MITFKDYYMDNLNVLLRKSKSDKHRGEVTKRLERFSEFHGNGRRDINDIKTNDIHLFMDYLITTSNLSERTANRYAMAVAQVMRNALLNDAIRHIVRVDYFPETRGRPRYFSDEEITKSLTFLRYSDHPYMEHMLTLSLHTGARLGEIIRIGVDEEVLTDDDGDRLLWLPDSKNGEERHIPLSDDAYAAVEALRAINKRLRSGKERDSSQRGPVRRHFFYENEFYSTWNKLRAKVAPSDKHFVFHVARHTAATHLSNRLNLSALVISKILGHKDIKTTMKYTKLEPTTAKNAAKGMQALSDARQAKTHASG